MIIDQAQQCNEGQYNRSQLNNITLTLTAKIDIKLTVTLINSFFYPITKKQEKSSYPTIKIRI
jgi:hypothetical protein